MSRTSTFNMRQCLALLLSGVFAFGQQAPASADHVLPAAETIITPEPRFGTHDYLRRRFFRPSTVVNVAGRSTKAEFIRGRVKPGIFRRKVILIHAEMRAKIRNK